MAVLVMLLLLGGAVQAANHASPPAACAIELDDGHASDIAIPVPQIRVIAIARTTLSIVMPTVVTPIGSVVSARTFRPPRG